MAIITRRQVAELIGVKEGTLRKYEREFAAWLVSSPGVKGLPKAKTYEEDDIRTLYVIHQLRLAHVSYEDMKAGQLDEALESGAYEVMPEDAQATQEGEEPKSLEVVPVREYTLVVGQLQATEGEMARVLETAAEREEKYEERLREERERVLEAEKRAAAAQATTDERDRLLEERDKAQATTEELRRQLEEERAKNWWQKLRGQ